MLRPRWPKLIEKHTSSGWGGVEEHRCAAHRAKRVRVGVGGEGSFPSRPRWRGNGLGDRTNKHRIAPTAAAPAADTPTTATTGIVVVTRHQLLASMVVPRSGTAARAEVEVRRKAGLRHGTSYKRRRKPPCGIGCEETISCPLNAGGRSALALKR